nr:sedoheptulose 7-phosphate cyclase [Clostridium botulinum]
MADVTGSAYLYRRNTPHIREMISTLKTLDSDLADNK